MERKYLGMDKKIAYGLGYIIPIVLLILLITDKELDMEEKRLALAGIFACIISSVIWIYLLLQYFAAIKYFMDDFNFKPFGAYQLAALFIK